MRLTFSRSKRPPIEETNQERFIWKEVQLSREKLLMDLSEAVLMSESALGGLEKDLEQIFSEHYRLADFAGKFPWCAKLENWKTYVCLPSSKHHLVNLKGEQLGSYLESGIIGLQLHYKDTNGTGQNRGRWWPLHLPLLGIVGSYGNKNYIIGENAVGEAEDMLKKIFDNKCVFSIPDLNPKLFSYELSIIADKLLEAAEKRGALLGRISFGEVTTNLTPFYVKWGKER